MADPDVRSIYSEVDSLVVPDDFDDDGDSILTVDQTIDGDSELGDAEEADKTTEQSMKALEAAEEYNNTRPDTSDATSRSSTPRSSRGWPDPIYEHTPLLDAGPAPPDYSQATAYRTFAQPNPYRRRGHEQPEEPAAEDDGDELESAFKAASQKKLKKYVRQNWRQVCLLNLAIYSLLVTLILGIKYVLTWRGSSSIRDMGIKYPEHASLLFPDKSAEFHRNTPECSFDHYFMQGLGGFSPRSRNMTFIEDMTPPSEFADFHVSGNIDIRPAPYDQGNPVEFWLSVATAGPWKAVDQKYEVGDNYLGESVAMLFPVLNKMADADSKGRTFRTQVRKKPCLDFWITIYVKHIYDTWNIEAAYGNINLGYPKSFNTDDNWMFRVGNDSRLSTAGGNISVSYLDARHLDLRSTTGSITGNFSFDDTINFASTSGDIDVLINQSMEYTGVKKCSRITSSTETGNTNISLHHEAVDEEYMSMYEQYDLHSHHQSQSGNISLSYNGWNGTLTASTSKGSVGVDGTEVESEYCKDSTGAEAGRPHAGNACVVKGSINSTTQVDSYSGNIEVGLHEMSHYWPAVSV